MAVGIAASPKNILRKAAHVQTAQHALYNACLLYTSKGVPMLDKTQVIKILTDGGTVCGLLCLNVTAQDAADRFTLIRCNNVIWATGGPAGMYADSVYPFSQYGATGLALEAGAKGKNLTECPVSYTQLRSRRREALLSVAAYRGTEYGRAVCGAGYARSPRPSAQPACLLLAGRQASPVCGRS